MKSTTLRFQLSCLLLFVLGGPLLAQKITVKSATPSSASQGTTLTVLVAGSGFAPGARVDFLVTGTTNPGGVLVHEAVFKSSSELSVDLTALDDAVVSNYDILVTNTNGRTGKGIEKFAVSSKSTLSAVDLSVTIEDGYAIGPDSSGVSGCISCGGLYVSGVDGVLRGIIEGGTISLAFGTWGGQHQPPTPRRVYFNLDGLIEAFGDCTQDPLYCLPDSNLQYAAGAGSSRALMLDTGGNTVPMMPGVGDCPDSSHLIPSGPLQTMVTGDCQIHQFGIGFTRYPPEEGDPPTGWRLQFHRGSALPGDDGEYDDNTSYVAIICLADTGGVQPRCSKWEVAPIRRNLLGEYPVARLVRADDPPRRSKTPAVMVVTPLGYFEMPFKMILEALQ